MRNKELVGVVNKGLIVKTVIVLGGPKWMNQSKYIV